MKRIVFAFALSLSVLSLSLPATAQFTGPSASPQASTVAAVGNARVGSDVTLTGNVVGHLRDEYFTFRDETGEIRVEIENKTWQGRKVGPEDKVRITGEIERGFGGRYIDVQTLEVLAP
ncbi:YgiW/YdeI family stress tolerance OB fold protein [Pseudoxanthomonas daejeonensis]|uniref:Bacterial OB-fold domain-containing protein n=1 Tax=Pseudoxanthomonas daejeonensis TaxID=266062 RepID=A0ABQ6Z6I2_9GAMM|nr:NirD/YgiW/YdeI family stress tolerance protein [Pseudoxanthomonas daejeonensis]KAF1694321.1 hypothetical protein CSC65_09000 [Pseudoxanthomonas daejeonensis]